MALNYRRTFNRIIWNGKLEIMHLIIISVLDVKFMTDVVFVFEVHQPHRLKRSLFWEGKVFRRLIKEDLFDYYFDNEVDREIFNRAARKCYFPSNQILLDLIDKHKHDRKQVKFSFSISGVFLEQCEMFDPDLIETLYNLPKQAALNF